MGLLDRRWRALSIIPFLGGIALMFWNSSAGGPAGSSVATEVLPIAVLGPFLAAFGIGLFLASRRAAKEASDSIRHHSSP